MEALSRSAVDGKRHATAGLWPNRRVGPRRLACRSVRIGVPRQDAPGEERVALTPDVVRRIVSDGHEIVVDAGAGERAGFRDQDYTEAGAQIGDAWSAELIATISSPDWTRISEGAGVIGLLRPLEDPEQMQLAADRRITTYAFEALPRTTRAQSMDVLSSQATVAGYQAVLEAAVRLKTFMPMLTTAAGTIRPSKVLVLGAGVAGLQAIATSRRLGAVTSAFDVRAAAAEQVESLGATFVAVDMEPQDASTSGGYARELEDDTQQRIIDGLAPSVIESDAVICTAQIPGRPAPLLIEERTVRAMKPGSVIVDLAAGTGGNCAVTEPGRTVEVGGVTVIGATDLVSRTARDASRMYARNTLALLELILAGPDFSDEILDGCCITHDGEIRNERVKEALE